MSIQDKVHTEGYLPNLNEEYRDILEKFKKKVKDWTQERPNILEYTKDYDGDDAILLRFLRAREFDLDKSFELITEALEWRTNFGGKGVNHLDPNE